jgi:hypothetical protein
MTVIEAVGATATIIGGIISVIGWLSKFTARRSCKARERDEALREIKDDIRELRNLYAHRSPKARPFGRA